MTFYCNLVLLSAQGEEGSCYAVLFIVMLPRAWLDIKYILWKVSVNGNCSAGETKR